ncbi:MAG: sigma factor, partial [Verrucomicrobiaceae bacterium]
MASGSFLPTQWSMVRKAASSSESGADQALASVCQSCWYPIYAFIRRSGQTAQDAEDLTQGFFEKLIEKNILASADPEKGRLRAFLLTCLKRFMADEHDRVMTQKRGGGKVTNFSSEWAEERFATEPVDDMTPDRLYQRRWALNLLECTVLALEERYAADGKADRFTELKPFLGFTSGGESYETLAERLGENLNTVKSYVHRLREEWRSILKEQVASTLE